MDLIYIGPSPAEVGIVPCPEGWPAADHVEQDAGLAAEKVASGLYEEANAGPRARKPAKAEEE